MINRLTAAVAWFAVLSAATITFAAGTAAHDVQPTSAVAAPAAVVIELPRVEVIGRRLPR